MASASVPSTLFQTPDPAFGGPAVSSPSNTGHGSSTVSSSSPSTSEKSCRWSGFAPPGVPLVSATIKVDWNRTAASLSGPGFNDFFIEYSLDGGSNWSVMLLQSNVSGPATGTASVAISTGQDFSQVRVRDVLQATGDVGGSASLTFIISDIRIEITYTVPPQVLLSSMM
jgi:hypothetical protein